MNLKWMDAEEKIASAGGVVAKTDSGEESGGDTWDYAAVVRRPDGTYALVTAYDLCYGSYGEDDGGGVTHPAVSGTLEEIIKFCRQWPHCWPYNCLLQQLNPETAADE